MISDEGIALLADFGLSQVLENMSSGMTTSTVVGAVSWADPAVLRGDRLVDIAIVVIVLVLIGVVRHLESAGRVHREVRESRS